MQARHHAFALVGDLQASEDSSKSTHVLRSARYADVE